MSNADVPLTIGKTARALGVDEWRVRRVFERKFLPEPPRVGPYRVILPCELGAVADALVASGLVIKRPTVPGEALG
jgi:hypothetical protein